MQLGEIEQDWNSIRYRGGNGGHKTYTGNRVHIWLEEWVKGTSKGGN